MQERRVSYRVLVGKTEGRRPLRRPRYIYIYIYIYERIILRKIFRKWDEGLDWTDLAQDRDR